MDILRASALNPATATSSPAISSSASPMAYQCAECRIRASAFVVRVLPEAGGLTTSGNRTLAERTLSGMWPPEALEFLRELEANNDRGWFTVAQEAGSGASCIESCIAYSAS